MLLLVIMMLVLLFLVLIVVLVCFMLSTRRYCATMGLHSQLVNCVVLTNTTDVKVYALVNYIFIC